MLKKLTNRFERRVAKLDTHYLELVKKSSASLVVSVVGVFLALAVSLSLGQLIGPEGLGLINLSHRIVNILLLFGLFGVQNVIVKRVAIDSSIKRSDRIANTMLTSTVNNGLLSACIAILLIIFARPICVSIFDEPLLVTPLRIALSVMTFQVLSRIYSSGLVGLRKIWQSNLVDQTLSYLVIALLLVALHISRCEITVITVALVFAISRVFVSVSVFSYWKRLFSFKKKKVLITRKLFMESFPLFIATISTTVINNSDLIILGIISTTKEIGFYSIAAQIAILPRMLLLVINSALSPQITILFGTNRHLELEKLIQRTVLTIITFSVVIFCTFFFIGESILELWGHEFVQAYPVLLILSIGHLYNLSTGPTGIMMIMCGLEKTYRNNQVIVMMFCLASSITMAYYYGIWGVAIAQMMTRILNNSIEIVIVRWKLGIMILPTTIFRLFAK